MALKKVGIKFCLIVCSQRRLREIKIARRQRLPFGRLPWRVIEKMGDGLPRAQHRAPSVVERNQASRRFTGEPRRDFFGDFGAEHLRANQRAFDAKIGEFVEGIDLTQLGVELQTVEYSDGIAKADMLWPQIAMSVTTRP